MHFYRFTEILILSLGYNMNKLQEITINSKPEISDWEDFHITWDGSKHGLEYGNNFPGKGSSYLDEYFEKIAEYKNISPDTSFGLFSLFQPPLATFAGKRSLVNRLRRRFQRHRTPAAATIGLTKRCQCRCLHCSASYHINSDKKELERREMITAIGETVDLGAVNIIFVGGEPMLRKAVYDIIGSIDKERAIVTMFTNGEFITKENCGRLKEAGLFGMFFSLDSHIGSVHDANRKRKGIFSKLRQGIDNALEQGLVVAVSSYLNHDNLKGNHFDNMMEFGKASGVHEVTFFDAISVGRYMVNGNGNLLNMEDHQKILELTRNYRSLGDYPAVSPQSVLTSEVGSSFCYAANTQFYLSATGEVTPCDFTPLSIGKYPEFSIRELWDKLITGPLYKKRSKVCRMQDPGFRALTIDRIPEGAALPYPIELLSG